ncbi:carboxymuconolactone decarboxylase family protein [Catellatospora sp. NPDC049133]|jgi:AhpD family alkylhydroperoxidase|uniref:carboxymuconolactone decarboxylase family protein n=1 Tax=Catellatospora sp. NPDC049133 TaxID=3155499 RepID=UPI0033E7C09E
MTTGPGEPRVLIDKQHPQVYRAQRDLAAAVRQATRDAGLDRVLVELVNIRVSQLNRCAYCLNIHVRDTLAGGESPQRIAVLPAWHDTTLFTDKERAALTLAESLTTLPGDGAQERHYAFARQHLTDDEISALSWVAIAMNAFNRISIISRHPVSPQAPADPSRDGGNRPPGEDPQ